MNELPWLTQTRVGKSQGATNHAMLTRLHFPPLNALLNENHRCHSIVFNSDKLINTARQRTVAWGRPICIGMPLVSPKYYFVDYLKSSLIIIILYNDKDRYYILFYCIYL